jgi:hypothetical protein
MESHIQSAAVDYVLGRAEEESGRAVAQVEVKHNSLRTLVLVTQQANHGAVRDVAKGLLGDHAVNIYTRSNQ